MAERIADHPDWEELEAYGQGRLAPEAARTLEEHLAGCTGCCDRLAGAPGDSFLTRLRQAGTGTDAGSTGPTLGDAPAVPPELIDHPRYRVLGPVGQGGMGAVYRAEHRRMERVVALKVIHPALMRQPDAVERFHREVRAAARLHHPNIVTAFDADQAGGLHFLVMEYVEGTNLADRVRRGGPLPVAEACACARQAALGLQHAHERGMVHRDVKPHNLMLAGSGPQAVVKILDFGLARLARGPEAVPGGDRATGPLTGAGAVMGTADYIAPEQAADPRAADTRADVYALGCTLFYLLTGRPPFPEGTVREKLARHADAPLPLDALPPGVPPGLVTVLTRMTAKDPAARYATPAEVAEALAPFCPPGDAGRSRAGKRWRRTVALALLAAGLLAGAVFWRLHADRKGPAPAAQPPQAPAPAEAGLPAGVSEDEAARAVRKAGGKVVRDNTTPGNPVVEVSFLGTKAGDADLQAVAAFAQLRSLTLNHTRVTDAGLSCLIGLKQLTDLDLTGTRVTDAGMECVGGMKQLRSLALGYTRVGDAGIKHLAGLTELHTLMLSGLEVTDASMPDVGRFKKLITLRLEVTGVTDAGLANLAGLTVMDNLGLNGSREIGDEGMKTVARFKRLRALYLTGTGVTDRGLKELAGLGQLMTLQLAGLKVTDAGVASLAGLKDLRMLSLASTEVTDRGLKGLAKNHPLLSLVDLQNLQGVTDAGVRELRGLLRLKHVGLANTRVTDDGLRALAECPRLVSVNLITAREVTDAGVAVLRKARPGIHILR